MHNTPLQDNMGIDFADGTQQSFVSIACDALYFNAQHPQIFQVFFDLQIAFFVRKTIQLGVLHIIIEVQDQA